MTHTSRDEDIGAPWVVIALASSASTVTDFHIFAFGAILPQVNLEFALSNVQRGFLSGLGLLGIALLRFPSGMVVDKLGPRSALALGLLFIGIGQIAAGFSQSTSGLGFAQILSGYGMAQSVVAGQPLIGRGLPMTLHRTGMGVFNFGFGFGAVLGFIVAPAMVEAMGWRPALRVLGAAVILIAFVALSARTGLTREPPDRQTNRGILSDARVWYLAVHMALVFGVFVATATWISTVNDASVSTVWLVAAFPFGYMLGSLGVGKLRGTYPSDTLVWLGPLMAAAALVILPGWGVVSLIVGSLLGGAFIAVGLAARDAKVAEFWAKGGMGRAYGTISAVGALGAFLCPVFAGYVLEWTGSVGAVFLALAVLLVISAPTGYRAMRLRPDSSEGPATHR